MILKAGTTNTDAFAGNAIHNMINENLFRYRIIRTKE
jgi:stalled ribosome alternative rescue factor ArfA